MTRLAILIAIVALFGCVHVKPVPDGGFEITPSVAQADPGETVKINLSQAVPGLVWTTTAGSITQDGTFTAPGCSAQLPVTSIITATSGEFTATASIVTADRVTGIAINPITVTLIPGASQQFTAVVKTACNPAGTLQVVRPHQKPKPKATK